MYIRSTVEDEGEGTLGDHSSNPLPDLEGTDPNEIDRENPTPGNR